MVHDVAVLLGKALREAPAEDREVLREDEDLAPEDLAVAGDDGVAPRPPLHHPEVRLAVTDVAVELDERARVAEPLGSLSREELPLRPLALDRLRAAGVARLVAEGLETLEPALRRFRARSLLVCRRHAPERTPRRSAAPLRRRLRRRHEDARVSRAAV